MLVARECAGFVDFSSRKQFEAGLDDRDGVPCSRHILQKTAAQGVFGPWRGESQAWQGWERAGMNLVESLGMNPSAGNLQDTLNGE